MDLYVRVKNKISKYISRNDSVLACVSGGADSAAMLNILDRLKTPVGFKLYAAHFNHKLRGKESDKDAAFVSGRKKRPVRRGTGFFYAARLPEKSIKLRWLTRLTITLRQFFSGS